MYILSQHKKALMELQGVYQNYQNGVYELICVCKGYYEAECVSVDGAASSTVEWTIGKYDKKKDAEKELLKIVEALRNGDTVYCVGQE